MIVIIGAGPSGLYLVLKLLQAGLYPENVVVYDPRANTYTRPGFLDERIYQEIEKGLETTIWSGASLHIKDLERGLYALAKELKVRFEKKQFVRLHHDGERAGVVVMDEMDRQEFVAATVVFDCSGQRRVVIHEVNRICPASPFKLMDVVDYQITTHFIAHVRMQKEQIAFFKDTKETLQRLNPITDPLHVARSLVKLRALGWTHMITPHCLATLGGKDGTKVCFYMQAPDDLEEKHYDEWVQCVLECHLYPVQYEHLDPSRKYKSKPRFQPFTLSTKMLNQVSYEEDYLPTVCAIGDAQKDINYTHGDGMFNNVLNINLLFEKAFLKILDGQLITFNGKGYTAALGLFMREHKAALEESAFQEQVRCIQGLDVAESTLIQGMTLSTLEEEKNQFYRLVQEIILCKNYRRAQFLFEKIHDQRGRIGLSTVSDTVLKTLYELHDLLMLTVNELPIVYKKERQHSLALLVKLARSWSSLGMYFVQKNNLTQTVNVYNQALRIYHLSQLQVHYLGSELVVYSELAEVYFTMKDYSNASASARRAVELYEKMGSKNGHTEQHEKNIFNLIRAVCACVRREISQQHYDEVILLLREVQRLRETYQNVLSDKLRERTDFLINDLDSLYDMDSSPSVRSLNSEKQQRDGGSSLLEWGLFSSTKRTASTVAELCQSCTIQ